MGHYFLDCLYFYCYLSEPGSEDVLDGGHVVGPAQLPRPTHEVLAGADQLKFYNETSFIMNEFEYTLL